MHRCRPTSVAVLLCVGVLTSGCTADTTTRSAPSTIAAVPPHKSAGTTPAPSSAATATVPSDSPTAPAPSSSSSPSSAPPATEFSPEPDSPPSRAGQAQIPAARLPGFSTSWRWTSTGTPHDQLSPCLLTPLTSIGAVRQVGRTYRGSSEARTSGAAQLTGVFPDEHTARTAEAVLVAWHDRCAGRAKQLGLQDVNVSEMRGVPTTVGTAYQWTLRFGPVVGEPHSLWFVSQGFVRDGDTITVLVYRSARQDYKYAPGQEPVDRGLQVASNYLKATR